MVVYSVYFPTTQMLERKQHNECLLPFSLSHSLSLFLSLSISLSLRRDRSYVRVCAVVIDMCDPTQMRSRFATRTVRAYECVAFLLRF